MQTGLAPEIGRSNVHLTTSEQRPGLTSGGHSQGTTGILDEDQACLSRRPCHREITGPCPCR